MYRAAYEAHADMVRRAFVVAARRLDAREEPVHRATISSVRYFSPDACHITVTVYRETGAQVHYGFRVYGSDLDKVTDAEIERWSAHVAEKQYEEDVRAYTRIVMQDDETLDYLREL